ncbi:Thiamin diphosphate-binding fold [Moorella glycerini]|uniref:NADH-dependent phenylglyoxylate dehydrogenase subunit alpha n=1 Tax=Neomoorella stamsii TaxID=1266720 RepID=A0A9X7J3M0_9FIRM|nr:MULTISPECIES: 3-methyl-2-oxobutanoate dehydrogenase subunit VorB [Moorella]PRR73969.1 NADH-dependent phenylglyoxylate dehydrogenase subunit alpha [Moorella stamsii]CEP66180.1 Thiamin diphosphate-binding fold [Moorella glycerini]
MGNRILMKGNEAIAEAAIRAGCRFFAGYPITPQNEIPEYMSRRLPEVGGTFVQAESEVSAINMLYGASGAGARVMTSSSSPGISLMQEGISYLAATELPAVIVNMVRGGPGLGGIQAAQSDYFQATKGGGHGDYHLIVLLPASIQEMVNLTRLAFDLADRYRNAVMVLADAVLGQAMEPVSFVDEPFTEKPFRPWATTGWKGDRPRNVINSLYLEPEELEKLNLRLQKKYAEISAREKRWETVNLSDAEVALVAYGTTARICRNAMEKGRAEGLEIGLIRPITAWPFPEQPFEEALALGIKKFLVVEMNYGQMVEDVCLVINGRGEVAFFGRAGGMMPTPAAIVQEVRKLIGRGNC